MRQATVPALKRHGFTLIEVLVVIAILITLASLTLGSVLKGMQFIRAANTERTMQKVSVRIASKLEALQKEAQGRQDLSPNLLALAAGDRRRARAILLNFLVKWHTPMHYDEIVQNVGQSAFFWNSSGAPHPITLQLNARRGSRTGGLNNPAVRGACLALIYESLGSLDDMTGAELQDTDGDGLPEILDGWGRPMVYYRWPVLYLNSTGQNRIERDAFPLQKWGTDLYDPQGLLDLRKTENFNPNNPLGWYQTPLPSPPFPGVTCGVWFETNLHPLRLPTDSQRNPVYCPWQIVSAGPDGQLGLSGPFMSIANAQQEYDNLYSYRLGIGLSGQ